MIKIFYDLEQNTEAWTRTRMGLVTASVYSDMLAKGEGKSRRTLMYKLAGERISGLPCENYSNGFMARGHAMEPEARDLYSFTRDVEPILVGFIRNGETGCSPDSLIGADGLLEIKTKAPHLLIDVLLKDEFPPEHKAQVQGQLWVAEREWCDFACYFSGMPLFVKRVARDNGYIANLSGEVDRFNDELAALVDKLKRLAG